MGVFTDHPHTAITDTVNAIINNSNLDPEVELPSLLSLIKLQYSGPTEAARAMRKHLKYSGVKQQLKALDLLNCIVVNGGKEMTEIYNDKKLLQQLRDMAVNVQLNKTVRVKVINLAIAWHQEFAGQKYYQGIYDLKSRMPDYEKKMKSRRQREDIDFMNDEAIHDDDDDDYSSGPRSNADLNRKYKIPVINLTKEAPRIRLLIADSSTSSINLTNSLHALGKNQHPATDKKTQSNFDKARIIRRKILRYLQLVDSEEFLGSLIHANEELVTSLQLYTEYAKRADEYNDNSDDDYFDSDEEDQAEAVYSSDDSDEESMISEVVTPRRAAPSIPVKKRQDSDVNDPFGDSNAVDEAANWK
ncbi:hypothetical protein WICPIJ_002028 [Wickerhamomyces pijperi]|uniref:VHS domain-containing protein n=1 Tax=Wickerhamomyces pijperi TaxID=599730 RepID=A0A9P8TPC3_WICPI|nr:hypothetical protein WICPIJ_002028 [Wickerhamomyces pijperi]